MEPGRFWWGVLVDVVVLLLFVTGVKQSQLLDLKSWSRSVVWQKLLSFYKKMRCCKHAWFKITKAKGNIVPPMIFLKFEIFLNNFKVDLWINPWCRRQMLYIISCVYSSSFWICKPILSSSFGSREMDNLVTPKIFLKIRDIFDGFSNSFCGLTLGATDKWFISSVASIHLVFKYVSQFDVALLVPEKWTI